MISYKTDNKSQRYVQIYIQSGNKSQAFAAATIQNTELHNNFRLHSCCVCDETEDPGTTGISFYPFPRNARQRDQWSAAIRLQQPNFTAKVRDRICSQHFDKYDVLGTDRHHIKQGALPKYCKWPHNNFNTFQKIFTFLHSRSCTY
jgi:hypothetical protein